ncbi:DUF3558 domain-containing protein [Saccharopolyspora sp. K220]|uniref:DUF3558 domain-containing protein n=1 Tax=Saccharopolyspora soli TaxID=2926618 RepID=UPI001F56F5A0|nr:DUF3558 domain-containing protein [Saccharopolyspora soli]MCI2418343.1 DUF3558 domain-containing protein [Saccharopolyspora soli]
MTRARGPRWALVVIVASLLAGCSPLPPESSDGRPSQVAPPEFGPMQDLCVLVPQSTLSTMSYADITHTRRHEDDPQNNGSETLFCRWGPDDVEPPSDGTDTPELQIRFHRWFRTPEWDRRQITATPAQMNADSFDRWYGRWPRTEIPGSDRAALLLYRSNDTAVLAVMIRNIDVEMRLIDKTASREILEQRLRDVATQVADQLSKMTF